MYESYYGLKRLPFENVLDTSFYYPSYGHREALSAVIYAINQKKGLVVVAGHPGTGKSFLIQLVKEQLLDTDYVIEIKSRIDLVRGLVERLEEVLSITPDEGFSQYRQDKLAERLEELGAEGGRIILLIDEAQTLNEEEMEYIRLLWNIESKSGKLIQTILFGQRELLDLLRKEEMQATLQRVQVFRVLKGLSLEDTKRYVQTRLKAAGSDEMVFTDDGVELIHTLSRGYLRMINQLCDQGMMSAYVSKNAFVGAEQIKAVIAENPIYMDVYELDVDEELVGEQCDQGYEIEEEKKVVSHKVVIREDNWDTVEGHKEEVVSSKKTGNQTLRTGMVVGAVIIGIVWLVVSSLGRQGVVKTPAEREVATVGGANTIVSSGNEAAMDNGPLYTIAESEELVLEKDEQIVKKEQETVVIDKQEVVVQEATKDIESGADLEDGKVEGAESVSVQQSAGDKLVGEYKDVLDATPSTTVVSDAVDNSATTISNIQAGNEKLESIEEMTPESVAHQERGDIKEKKGERQDIPVVQQQMQVVNKNEKLKGSATADTDAQSNTMVESAALKHEIIVKDAETKIVSSEHESRIVGANQDIPFPFSPLSEIASEEMKVVEGESLSKLALEKYGAWNWSLQDILTHINTNIKSVDFIQTDSRIKLPVFTREQMLVQGANGKYYIFLKTVDIEKVKAERKIYQDQGAGVRLQEVILSGHRKIRLYLGPMSDESLARDWLRLVQYDFAPFAFR